MSKYLTPVLSILAATILEAYAVPTALASNNPSNLQTFFTSNLERDRLNALRASGAYQGINKSDTSFLQKPLTVEMQGVVIRDNKKPVVFVNDENTLKTHHLSNDVTVRDHRIKTSTYKVPIKVNGQHVTLRPGEQWEELSNTVKDSYQQKATDDVQQTTSE